MCMNMYMCMYMYCTYVCICMYCSYDSSNPLAVGDVGMAGVAVDSVEDMKVVYIFHSHCA